MTPTKKHKVIITGTGRSGTTFLVQLLTELGLDTGYTRDNWKKDYLEHCSAGLEQELDGPGSPYIVKNPEFCRTLPAVLARQRITIDCALIPIRRLDDAALSRIRVGGSGDTPGGLTGTDKPENQKAALAENFHLLLETLVAHDIPHVLLHFPRFARDADYAFAKLRPVLGGIGRDEFVTAFQRVARPELIHAFVGGAPEPAEKPADLFTRHRSSRRFLRRTLRTAASLALVGIGWFAAGLVDADDDKSPNEPIEITGATAESPAKPRLPLTWFNARPFMRFGPLNLVAISRTEFRGAPMLPPARDFLRFRNFEPATFGPESIPLVGTVSGFYFNR